MEQCSYFCFKYNPAEAFKKKVCPLQSPISFRLGLLLLKRREMVIFLFFSRIFIYTSIRGKKVPLWRRGPIKSVCAGENASLYSLSGGTFLLLQTVIVNIIFLSPLFGPFHIFLFFNIYNSKLPSGFIAVKLWLEWLVNGCRATASLATLSISLHARRLREHREGSTFLKMLTSKEKLNSYL